MLINTSHFFVILKQNKMKWFVLSTLMIIGFCHAELSDNGQSHKKVLRKIVKRAIGDAGGQFLVQTEATIISNCKANGHPEVQTDLENAYSEMKRCAAKKSLFITPKDEYLSNLEECSRDAIRKTRDCLAEDQKYFPEFILALAKSVVTFMYDDFDIMKYDLPLCIRTIGNTGAQRTYIQCLTDTAARTHDTARIPSSKRSFCDKFIPASRCFTDMIKDNCKDTENLRKFRNDYIGAMEVPCGIKESY